MMAILAQPVMGPGGETRLSSHIACRPERGHRKQRVFRAAVQFVD